MTNIISAVSKRVRVGARLIAKVIDKSSGGRVTPNMITIVGLLAHLPIAWLIATGNYAVAGWMLIVFGLFDTLDGELARLQGKASSAGMVLDASTDRMKEVILYIGFAVSVTSQLLLDLASIQHSTLDLLPIAVVVAACGGSLLVSYVKAKGETGVKDQNLSPNQINRLFSGGIMPYELRMLVLAVGLITGLIYPALVIVAVFSWVAALCRLYQINSELTRHV